MKQLKTVQDVWSTCLYCPLCRDIIRNIIISMGPDLTCQLLHFKKIDKYLHLDCDITLLDKKYRTKFIIDCITNQFTIELGEPQLTETYVNKSTRPYFYFYINSTCTRCRSTCHSSDLELEFLEKKVSNIGIEREYNTISYKKDTYTVVTDYVVNETLIYKGNNDIEGEAFKIPLINFNLSDKQATINKIKTILVFS